MIRHHLLTSHGTTVCIDPATMEFVHGVPGAQLPPATLVTASHSTGLLVGTVAGPDHAPGIRFTIRGLRIAAGPAAGSAALVDPQSETFLAAELPAGEGPGPLTASRVAQGPWETFELRDPDPAWHGSEAPWAAHAAPFVASRPDAAGMLHGLARRPDPFITALLWQWFGALPLDKLDRIELLAANPAARTHVATPADPWLTAGIDGLAAWSLARDERPHRVRIGPELDVLGHAGEGPRRLGQHCIAELRRRASPRKTACVVATARNEGPYLVEWIAYHKLLGFEHVFLYTNDNADGSDHLLAALAEAGEITWIDSVIGAGTRPQFKAYGHALGILPDTLDYEWALMIDIDEFLVLDAARFRRVQDYLRWIGQRRTDSIALNWSMFGTFGELTPRGFAPLTSRSVHRFTEPWRHIKSIVRPRLFDHAEAHHAVGDATVPVVFRDSAGEPYRHAELFPLAAEPKTTHAWINHYWSKSFDELLLKFGRNRGDMFNVSTRSVADIAQDIEERVLAVEEQLASTMDAGLQQDQVRLAQQMASLRALPGVAQAEERCIEQSRAQIAATSEEFARLDLSAMPRVQDMFRRRLALDQA